MGKQAGRLVTTFVAALILVVVGIGAGLALVGLPIVANLPLIGPLFRVDPPETTTGPVTVGALRDLDELATIERKDYVFVTRESGGTDLGRIFTGEAVSLLAVGEVRAGIDLENLGENDIRVNEATRTVTINLPEARILDVSLDEEQTEVFDRDFGTLNFGRADDELAEEARDVAIQRLEAAAEEGDILEQANENAETTLRTFVLALGYKRVTFE
ncbi:DUF4230 domain-containing protein [Rubrobacter indicoceani]|uniref:DUF4230 domain-containing protein n=1 Tax=Rubrobacter indicoceani TaxID=2051957 RepID=UPI000E5B0E03|nr:DUF4230 domain-containing protein [Rubrobacter indicoceani]